MAAIAEPRRRIDMTSKRNQLSLGNMSTRGSPRANGIMPRTPSCRRERPSIARAMLNGIGFVVIPPISITTSQSPRRNYRPAETPCPECRARNDRRTFCAAAVAGATAHRVESTLRSHAGLLAGRAAEPATSRGLQRSGWKISPESAISLSPGNRRPLSNHRLFELPAVATGHAGAFCRRSWSHQRSYTK